MPKLDVTYDKIQLTTNMLTTTLNTENAAAWDRDDLYPSAAAVRDAIVRSGGGEGGAVCDASYPTGSVIITSTNTNPGLTFGGTWELFDKEYKASKDRVLNVDYGLGGLKAWEGENYSTAMYAGYAAKSGNDIRLSFTLTTRYALTGGSALGNRTFGILHPNEVGCTSFDPFNYQLHEDRFAYATDKDGLGVYMIRYVIYPTGEFILTHVYDKIGAVTGAPSGGALPAEAKIYLTADLHVNAASMLDKFCDKFYWKRTA